MSSRRRKEVSSSTLNSEDRKKIRPARGIGWVRSEPEVRERARSATVTGSMNDDTGDTDGSTSSLAEEMLATFAEDFEFWRDGPLLGVTLRAVRP